MRRVIVADAHLGQRPGDVEEMVGLLKGVPAQEIGEVVFLGDVCQYLIGMEKFWSRSVRDVLSVWTEIRAAGVRVVLIEGNRDFFLDEPDLAEFRDRSLEVYELAAGGRTFRLVHGDTVNQRDTNYRFWRRVSKSRAARVWARLLPRRLARWIVESMEARLARTNRKFRYTKPLDALRGEAERAWSEGVDVVLWGHFHEGWSYGEHGREAMIVPAWLESRQAIVVEPDGEYELVLWREGNNGLD